MFRATDTHLGREVAIKVVPAEGADEASPWPARSLSRWRRPTRRASCADGHRFVMIEEEERARGLTVVLNWFEELKRMAPVLRH